MNNENKTQEQLDDEVYNAQEYKKSTFSFSEKEIAELQPLEDATKLVQTFLALGQIAQKAKDNYVGGQVLNRLVIKKSQDSKFNYDLTTKKIIVYEPRIWCSQCDIRKAEVKFNDQPFCNVCIEDKKKTIGEPLEKKAEKKESAPKK